MAIPYAKQVYEDRKMYAVCPLCKKRIRLTKMKDFESFALIEYADHVHAEHPEAVTA